MGGTNKERDCSALVGRPMGGRIDCAVFVARRRRLSHGAANVALGVVNGIVGSVLFGAAILLATEWSRENSIGLLHHLPRIWPAWIQFVIGLVLFHHCNLRIARSADGALRAVFVTPWMHWVHHSMLREETNSNYGSVLSVWDRLFGSFRLRTEPSQLELGLSEDASELSWRAVLGMFLRPFR